MTREQNEQQKKNVKRINWMKGNCCGSNNGCESKKATILNIDVINNAAVVVAVRRNGFESCFDNGKFATNLISIWITTLCKTILHVQ